MKQIGSGKLILMMGLPGSGKTHLAKLLSNHFKLLHVSSDRVRRDMGKLGAYTLEDKRLIYDEVLRLTEDHLSHGASVIVDTTFSSQHLRDRFRQLADAESVEVYWILAYASEAVIKKRLLRKRVDSEADYEVYAKIKQTFDPLNMSHLRVRTDQESEEGLMAKVGAYCKLKAC